jgi:hypothetical protein
LKPSGIASKRTILRCASHSRIRGQDVGHDRDRRRPGAESATGGAVTEDGQQRADNAQGTLEDRSRLGSHRTSRMLRQAVANTAKCVAGSVCEISTSRSYSSKS